MKILSFNVNGIRAAVKKGLHESLAELNADVVCFQETKANVDQVREALQGTDYHVYANSAQKAGYSGTCIASKEEPLRTFVDMGIEEHDQEGRIIGAEFADFYLINVYVPNSGSGLSRLDYRKTWDDDFRAFLVKLDEEKPVILCGDLNVAHTEMDIKNAKSNYNKTSGYTQVEIDGLTALLDEGFVDSFRHLYPETIKYSWWSYRMGARGRNIGWRLDYFIVSEKLMPRIADSFILNDVLGSDHCPVGIEIK